jgi:3-hydroxyisobutyrate dehydrogenase-like beta-hydroxyacid dehydrogenase
MHSSFINLVSAAPQATVAVAPETARWLHEAGGGLGLSLFDVGISGGTPAAEFRILTLFGGHEVRVFEAAQPIFHAIAAQCFHMRPSGSDVAMKLVVSTQLGLGVQAIAGAVALVAGLGMLHDLVRHTRQNCSCASGACRQTG